MLMQWKAPEVFPEGKTPILLINYRAKKILCPAEG